MGKKYRELKGTFVYYHARRITKREYVPYEESHKISSARDSFSHAGRVGERGKQVYAARRTFGREEQ